MDKKLVEMAKNPDYSIDPRLKKAVEEAADGALERLHEALSQMGDTGPLNVLDAIDCFTISTCSILCGAFLINVATALPMDHFLKIGDNLWNGLQGSFKMMFKDALEIAKKKDSAQEE